MTLEAIIAQLTEAKARNLIVTATVNAAYLPAIVTVQLPHTTADKTLDTLRQFLKRTFPHTTVQTWRYQLPRNIICMSFTVDQSYHGETPHTI